MRKDGFVKFYLDAQFGQVDDSLIGIGTKLNRLADDIGKLRESLDGDRLLHATKFSQVLQKGDLTMGALTDLSKALADQGAAQSDIAVSQNNIANDVKHLLDVIAQGGTITEAQLRPLADKAMAHAAAAQQTAASLKALADSVPDDSAPTPPADPGP